jgi:aspartate/tyrosine/aromatic aminotransferase
MFEQIPASTPDAILGLNEVFLADPRPERVNLTVGVYVDQSGHTPILRSVKQAEQRLLETEQTKTYLNIAGDAEYGRLVRELLLGESHPLIRDRRVVSLQTPGGTGALRVTADFVAKHYPQANVWVSDPTWANHAAIFAAAGVPSKMYPYYDHRSHEVALQAMLDGLSQAPAGDFVILHGCCHNPTGADPNAEGWQQIAELCQTRSLLPIVDLAYQGFGHGMEEDVQGLKTLTEHLPEIIVCSSFSKSFGLYRERTGALCAIAGNAATAQTLLDAIKICVRRNYSNPPSHGAAIVATILGEPRLRAEWQRELSEMRANIQQKRLELANALTAASWREDVDFLRSQIGMFSLIGLPPEAIDKLREDYAVYLVRNGRLNMAGIQHSNLDYVVNSLLKVAE